ncbi:ATP-dependent Clp protease ATP-binding subunit ClpX [Fasciola hepatica]|uniref:ATP-dependent Clp protease ATP-binding subunit ClpX n=1 Tax=Fasciola hepatica TaxID=6192 RepID=A0A4E0REW4_FASHE|nr:ATP-dependent Clp protease ATP-binding subunit ClpX [Fasciola hepatica]
MTELEKHVISIFATGCILYFAVINRRLLAAIILSLGKPPSHPGSNDGETIGPPFQSTIEYGDPSEEKFGGGNGSGGGGSFVKCSKCGGPLRAIEPSSSYVSRFMKCDTCQQLYTLIDKSALKIFGTTEEARSSPPPIPKQVSPYSVG